jgi:hypothetical protein
MRLSPHDLHVVRSSQLRYESRTIALADTPDDVLVYADIPYIGTKAYNRTTFDHTSFWQWVRERNGPTFVSELTAPDGMQIVWRKAHKSQMTSNSPTSRATSGIVHREERLYYCTGRQ